MIQANDLRIGNLLNYSKWYKNITDKTWSVRDIYFEDNKIGLTDGLYQTLTKLDYLKPIPLTEEILLKVGFEINKDYLSEEHLWHDFVKDGVRIQLPYFEFKHEDGDYSVEIKHLHQLQNLYFALTGEELNTEGLI